MKVVLSSPLHMSACSFGAAGLNIKTPNFGCLRTKLRKHLPSHDLKVSKVIQYHGLVLPQRPKNHIIRCQSLAFEDNCELISSNSYLEEISRENESTALTPNAEEVHSLVTAVCDTTSIAEFELKLDGFRLYVLRDLSKQSAPVYPPPTTNGSAFQSSAGVETQLDKAKDEDLAMLQSPAVGYFKTSRTIKGKREPPSCQEKDIVEKSQVLCYIEQLGFDIPVESDISGEVVKILREDGANEPNYRLSICDNSYLEEISRENESTALTPNAEEVHSLVTAVCDTTSIAEFELKLDGFRLYVLRDLSKQSAPVYPPPTTNGSTFQSSLAFQAPSSSSAGVETQLNKAKDEDLAMLQSPAVGYFKISRTIKGKREPPSCQEKDIVEKGQVLCYIEQLGFDFPVESGISGEVVKILREDGEPVGYKDDLIVVSPLSEK